MNHSQATIISKTGKRTTNLSRPRWLLRKGSMALRTGLGLLRARILGLVPGLWFDRIGRGTRFWGFPRIQYWGGHIELGRHCVIGINVFFLVGEEGRISIGNRCSINDYCFMTSLSLIEIGDGVAIGEFVSIRDFDHEFDGENWVAHLGYVANPIRIGDGVWIGRGVVITKGVTIGEGSVIGANSVVTKDIPPRSVAVGSPARVIRTIEPGKGNTPSPPAVT
ncbi:MAG: acyltransferase [Planctomycetota bacterium]